MRYGLAWNSTNSVITSPSAKLLPPSWYQDTGVVVNGAEEEQNVHAELRVGMVGEPWG